MGLFYQFVRMQFNLNNKSGLVNLVHLVIFDHVDSLSTKAWRNTDWYLMLFLAPVKKKRVHQFKVVMCMIITEKGGIAKYASEMVI